MELVTHRSNEVTQLTSVYQDQKEGRSHLPYNLKFHSIKEMWETVRGSEGGSFIASEDGINHDWEKTFKKKQHFSMSHQVPDLVTQTCGSKEKAAYTFSGTEAP